MNKRLHYTSDDEPGNASFLSPIVIFCLRKKNEGKTGRDDTLNTVLLFLRKKKLSSRLRSLYIYDLSKNAQQCATASRNKSSNDLYIQINFCTREAFCVLWKYLRAYCFHSILEGKNKKTREFHFRKLKAIK